MLPPRCRVPDRNNLGVEFENTRNPYFSGSTCICVLPGEPSMHRRSSNQSGRAPPHRAFTVPFARTRFSICTRTKPPAPLIRELAEGAAAFPTCTEQAAPLLSFAPQRSFRASLVIFESAACGPPLRRAYRPQRRRGRVAEGGGLLNRYRVVKPYRGFESLRLRQNTVSACLSLHQKAQ
jgi:hypothetical protein